MSANTSDLAEEEEEGDEPPDPADALLERGAVLRKLRELELADERERRARAAAEEEDDEGDGEGSTVGEGFSSGGGRDEWRPYSPCGNGDGDGGGRVLSYTSYLSHQRYYDDLKHIDYEYIEYEVPGCSGAQPTTTTAGSDGGDVKKRLLSIEQDKSLGKGGLCWDAAFILADHVLATPNALQAVAVGGGGAHSPTRSDGSGGGGGHGRRTSVLELGCGTGLCGLLVACARPRGGLSVHLTDLPELMPLLRRNVDRAVRGGGVGPTCEADAAAADDDNDDGEHNQSIVSAYALDWATVGNNGDDDNDVDDKNQGRRRRQRQETFDVILGADVVASLYDPVALARTMHRLSHRDTVLYLSFKERLSTVHRRFEEALTELFDEWTVTLPSEDGRRNYNPDVRILTVRGPKGK